MSEIRDRRGRLRVQTVNEEPSKTVQSDAARADIRHILGKYKEIGIAAGMQQVGQFVDLSELSDYATAMRVVKAADSAFLQLPASARKAFNNDAAEWLDAVQGADNGDLEKLDQLVKAGLVKAPMVPEVVNEAVPAAPAVPSVE